MHLDLFYVLLSTGTHPFKEPAYHKKLVVETCLRERWPQMQPLKALLMREALFGGVKASLCVLFLPVPLLQLQPSPSTRDLEVGEC